MYMDIEMEISSCLAAIALVIWFAPQKTHTHTQMLPSNVARMKYLFLFYK